MSSVFLGIILVVILSISGFLANSMLRQPNPTVNPTSEPKAAIVDQLSLTFPNQTFLETAENTLSRAGYSVDYYAGRDVTVEFYRNLPTHGYDVIILRVHSAGQTTSGSAELGLFTSELYSETRYVIEQLEDEVGRIRYSSDSKETYFGIGPKFVQQCMRGSFEGATIIMIGCEGLGNPSMATAFIEKGAKVYIGWSDSVQAAHTDQATACLLQFSLIEKLTIKEAVANTMNEVGPDPAKNSTLIYYPLQAGNQTIDNAEK